VGFRASCGHHFSLRKDETMSTVESNWYAIADQPRTTYALARASEQPPCDECANVGDVERTISGLGGGFLVASGLRRGGIGGTAAAILGAGLVYRAVTGRCSLYQALGITTAHGHSDAVGVPAKRGRRHEVSVVIERPASQLFDYWRQLKNLPRLFDHLVSVVEKSDGRSHWVARGPLGQTIEWDAEIHNSQPGEMIAWRSIPGSDLDTAGSIHFKPTADEGRSIVTLNMKYNPPAGKVGSAIAAWLGQSVEGDLQQGLRRFKQIAETGEIPSVAGQPRGTCNVR
jgi:uncharacterized membrane protein